MAFIPLFSSHSKMDFEDFSNWLITSSGIFPKQYGVLSSAELAKPMSLQKRNISHKKILNESRPSVDSCDTPATISNHELN